MSDVLNDLETVEKRAREARRIYLDEDHDDPELLNLIECQSRLCALVRSILPTPEVTEAMERLRTHNYPDYEIDSGVLNKDTIQGILKLNDASADRRKILDHYLPILTELESYDRLN